MKLLYHSSVLFDLNKRCTRTRLRDVSKKYENKKSEVTMQHGAPRGKVGVAVFTVAEKGTKAITGAKGTALVLC